MDVLARFLAYAAAFEVAYESDDWSAVEPFFTEDAVYTVTGGPPFGGRWSGRPAVLARFREVLDQLDRRFDERILQPVGAPRVDGDVLEVDWRATYRLAGAPDAEISGTERATFAGDRIRLLEDLMEPGSDRRTAEYAARYLR
jgi:hypothetical protein